MFEQTIMCPSLISLLDHTSYTIHTYIMLKEQVEKPKFK